MADKKKDPAPRAAWRELENVGIRTPAIHLVVKDDEHRPTIETSEGNLVLGTGEWIVMSLATWQRALDAALVANQPTKKRDRRN